MRADHFSQDILDFILLLNQFKVKYLIVGGEAVIYYGYPRLTGDVDFFYKNTNHNIESLFDALLEFWDNDIPGIKNQKELAVTNYVVQFGIPPNRIDLMNSIDGVRFNEAWEEKMIEHITIEENRVPIYYLSLKHLLINKRISDRDKDRDDLSYLNKIDQTE